MLFSFAPAEWINCVINSCWFFLLLVCVCTWSQNQKYCDIPFHLIYLYFIRVDFRLPVAHLYIYISHSMHGLWFFESLYACLVLCWVRPWSWFFFSNVDFTVDWPTNVKSVWMKFSVDWTECFHKVVWNSLVWFDCYRNS